MRKCFNTNADVNLGLLPIRLIQWELACHVLLPYYSKGQLEV